MRISTTTLESFRLFLQPDQDWMKESDMLATIRGEFRPTPPVLLGKAYGTVLETPDACRVNGGYRSGDYFFRDDVIAPALAMIDRRGVFEARAQKAYGRHTVVAKADHLLGARLREFKTTLSTFNFDKYADSCQWRFMTDIFEPASITYHVFCLGESQAGDISLRSVETFNLFPYAALHVDCCALVDRFVEFVTERGLEGLLNERQRIAEAA